MPINHPAIPGLKAQFPQVKFLGSEFREQVQVVVPAEHLSAVVKFLKEDAQLNYNMLADITAVDYLHYPGAPKEGRFGLVYILNSIAMAGGEGTPRLILRVFLNEAAPGLEVDSLVPLYAGAEWIEREIYDMFGIKFKNHPDLRRILTWDSFQAHPLRKDYPVTGRGERENFPVLSKDSA